MSSKGANGCDVVLTGAERGTIQNYHKVRGAIDKLGALITEINAISQLLYQSAELLTDSAVFL